MTLFLHLVLIVMEIIGFTISISKRGAGILAYYTQLSNLVALLSSILLVVEWLLRKRGAREEVTSFMRIVDRMRYLACCMLTMTSLVTVFILTPATGDVREMLFSGSQLYHHTLCPILSVLSFILLEKRATARGDILIPVTVTILYGIIMICLNGAGLYDGPYPFFQVHRIGIPATILWVIVLMVVIALISWGIRRLSKRKGD